MSEIVQLTWTDAAREAALAARKATEVAAEKASEQAKTTGSAADHAVAVQAHSQAASAVANMPPGVDAYRESQQRDYHESMARYHRKQSKSKLSAIDVWEEDSEKVTGLISLARSRLASCPDCMSFDIKRMAPKSTKEGPMDLCKHCGKAFAHKTGTLTAEMHASRQDGLGVGAEPEAPGTTDTAGYTYDNPPVEEPDPTEENVDPPGAEKDNANAMTNPDGGYKDTDQEDLSMVHLGTKLRSKYGMKKFAGV